MSEFKDFIGIHKGATIVVCGLGESINSFKGKEDEYLTIGVNDIGRHFEPSYLVCIDSHRTFGEERYNYIKNTKASNVFSHINLPLDNPEKLVKIGYSEKTDYSLSNPNKLHNNYISPFVAVNIAYWMGASKIIVIGMDLNTHAAKSRIDKINLAFKHLHKSMANKGVNVYNASKNSLVRTLPFCEI